MSYEINLKKYKDPEIYKRNGKDCYFDSIKKILRPKTPEEIVRQKIIEYLIDEMGIPPEAMKTEVPMSHFKPGNRGRADIIVYAIDEEYEDVPVMVIECKAENVALTDEVFFQAYKYSKIIEAPIAGVSNGQELIFALWDEKSCEYKGIEKISSYKELFKPLIINLVQEEEPLDLSKIKYSDLINEENYISLLEENVIGVDTPKKFVPFIQNLHFCFQNDQELLESLKVQSFEFIEDGGLRYTSFGNAAGGIFTSKYRFFIIEDRKHNAQIISFSIEAVGKTIGDAVFGNSRGRTYLNVAIDDEKKHHTSLQLTIEDFTKLSNEYAEIWHDGKMSVGNIGSAKKSEVINYIKDKAPHLVDEKNQVILGRLPNDRLISINSKEMKDFLSNLILYSILRDELRVLLKKKK